MKKKKDYPLVSVIVIAYNEEKNISGCIKSILRQDYPNFELIVVDDGSKDHTSDIIKDFHDKRLWLLSHEKNRGYASARNTGLYSAKGYYAMFTDADCRASSGWISSGVECMANNVAYVGAGGRTTLLTVDGGSSNTDVASYKISLINSLFRVPGTMNIIYRSGLLRKVGGFDERFNMGGEDLDIALTMLTQGEIGFCKKMKIWHQKERMNFVRGFSLLRRRKLYVSLIKKHSDRYPLLRRSKVCYGFIVSPYYFFSLFPPLIFLALMEKGMRITSLKDVLFLPVLYFGLWYQRFHIWHAAIKERIFLI